MEMISLFVWVIVMDNSFLTVFNYTHFSGICNVYFDYFFMNTG